MPAARTVLLVAAAFTPAAAAQTPYTATRIAVTGQAGFASVGGDRFTAPAISAGGQVAFLGSTTAADGVYRGDGQTATLIHAAPAGGFGPFYSGLAVSTVGAVSFYYNPSATAGFASIYTGDGTGPAAVVADGSQTGSYSSLGLQPGANAAGTVAFYGRTAATGFAVFAGTPGNVTVVAHRKW